MFYWRPDSVTVRNRPVAENIKRILKDKKLTRKEVAEKAGIAYYALSDMLNGRMNIYACDIAALALALDVSVAELFQAPDENGQKSDSRL